MVLYRAMVSEVRPRLDGKVGLVTGTPVVGLAFLARRLGVSPQEALPCPTPVAPESPNVTTPSSAVTLVILSR